MLSKTIMRFNLGNSEQRVKLLKAGFSGKEIEKLYTEQNSFKIVHNILYEGIEFNVHGSSIYMNNIKAKSILTFGIVGLFLPLLVPISTVFLALLLTFLFVPPMFAFSLILIEGIPIISKELKPTSIQCFPSKYFQIQSRNLKLFT